MLSKRAKYAIKALIYMSSHMEDLPISARVISEAEKIPYKFLENILRELKQNRFVKSERGASGGYTFHKDPSEISLKEVMRVMDGPIALIPCVSLNFYEKCEECISEETCQIRKMFLHLRYKMVEHLDKSILELRDIV